MPDRNEVYEKLDRTGPRGPVALTEPEIEDLKAILAKGAKYNVDAMTRLLLCTAIMFELPLTRTG